MKRDALELSFFVATTAAAARPSELWLARQHGCMKDNLKLLLLPGLLLAGIIAQQKGYIDLASNLEGVEAFAQTWWALLAVVLIQTTLYLFAFPGSLLVWSLGVLYQPWVATLLVVIGGLSGSLAAYFFASGVSASWTARFARSKAYRLLQQNSGFLQLFALRCMPGFPHSFLNYSSGILKINLFAFVSSTVLGFALKGYIYCSAIYYAFHIEDTDQAISITTLLPLVLLVLLSLVGILIKKRFALSVQGWKFFS